MTRVLATSEDDNDRLWLQRFAPVLSSPSDLPTVPDCIDSQRIRDSRLALPPVGIGEMTSAIRQLPLRRSPGPDLLAYEHLKWLPETAVRQLASTYTEILRGQLSLPTTCFEAIVHPVYKRGDRFLADNYRPIVLLPVMMKLLEFILIGRVEDNLRGRNAPPMEQTGFRHGQGAVQTILATCLLIKNRRHMGQINCGSLPGHQGRL
jgi:hypothetical protein